MIKECKLLYYSTELEFSPCTMVTVEGFYCSLQVRPYASKGQAADITVWTKTLAGRGCFACKLIQGFWFKSRQTVFFYSGQTACILRCFVHSTCKLQEWGLFWKEVFHECLLRSFRSVCACAAAAPELCWTWHLSGNSRKALCDPYLLAVIMKA